MATGNMKFESGKAQKLASDMVNNANQSRNIVQQVGKDIQATQQFWKGPSAQAYTAEFERLKPKMEQLIKCVDDISKQLVSIAKIQDDSEKELASSINKS